MSTSSEPGGSIARAAEAAASTSKKSCNVMVVTGSGGLVGSATCSAFAERTQLVVGIDNDLRSHFFGTEASTLWATRRLISDLDNYRHVFADIRNMDEVENVFREYNTDISLVVHTAAQPSHDWAAGDPVTDFAVNATGTLNLLEATRRWSPRAVFIFTSTNKVYGERPNELPLIELDTRWELDTSHPYAAHGIAETMSVDMVKHSLFGASKLAADILVQEYGRYFGLETVTLRAGCLTGPGHSGAQLHGFLAYLMKCTVLGLPYTIFGYAGKQVRDNLHSVDLVAAFGEIYEGVSVPGEVYNMGGGRYSSCSMLEAIALSEKTAGKRLKWTYDDNPRIGDHIWWISDYRRFQAHYPNWQPTKTIEATLTDIHDDGVLRWDDRAQ